MTTVRGAYVRDLLTEPTEHGTVCFQASAWAHQFRLTGRLRLWHSCNRLPAGFTCSEGIGPKGFE